MKKQTSKKSASPYVIILSKPPSGLLANYSAAPDAASFQLADIAELISIRAEIQMSERTSTTTPWSRAAWETDIEGVTKAIRAAESGAAVLVAQDEDGYYFAEQGKEKKMSVENKESSTLRQQIIARIPVKDRRGPR